MYAISLWLIASLRIFSGRPVLTGADSTSDDDEGSDDELEYMIWPLHSLSHTKIFMHDADILGAFKPYQGRVYITVEHCLYKI